MGESVVTFAWKGWGYWVFAEALCARNRAVLPNRTVLGFALDETRPIPEIKGIWLVAASFQTKSLEDLAAVALFYNAAEASFI